MTKVSVKEKTDSFRLGRRVKTRHYEIKGKPPFVESIKEV